jgi:hypothetical protein
VLWTIAIILKANEVNLFVSSELIFLVPFTELLDKPHKIEFSSFIIRGLIYSIKLLCTCRYWEVQVTVSLYICEMCVPVKAIQLVKETLQMLCSVRPDDKRFRHHNCAGFSSILHSPYRPYTWQLYLVVSTDNDIYPLLVFISFWYLLPFVVLVFTYSFFVLACYLLTLSHFAALYSAILPGVSPLCTWDIYHVSSLGFDFPLLLVCIRLSLY